MKISKKFWNKKELNTSLKNKVCLKELIDQRILINIVIYFDEIFLVENKYLN